MNEMKSIFKRWLLANYTSVKRFAFWKVSAKICNFRVPVYKGFPSHDWNDTHSLSMTASQVYYYLKDSLSEKWVLKYTTLGVPFRKGFPSHEWNETRALTMTAGQLYFFEKFHFLNSEC